MLMLHRHIYKTVYNIYNSTTSARRYLIVNVFFPMNNMLSQF